MLDKHKMRKGYYEKMKEWKESIKKEGETIDIQREKAIRNYQNIGKNPIDPEINQTR